MVIERVTMGPATPPYRWNSDRIDITPVEELRQQPDGLLSDTAIAKMVSTILRRC
jgi:hypothetical protein